MHWKGYQETISRLRPLMFTRDVTAWEVLERVKELVREEPKRLRMCNFGVLRGEAVITGDEYMCDFPRCGAVGCISGWAAIVTGRLDEMESFGGLGLTSAQRHELYYPEWWTIPAFQQTAEGAEEAIRHIERFQAAHEAHLKAYVVEVKRLKHG